MRWALGLALGEGQLTATALDPEQPSHRLKGAMQFRGGTVDETLDAAERLTEKLFERSGERPEFCSVGAAIPGHINYRRGFVVFGQNLAKGDSWVDEDVAAALSARFGAPALVDNDVNCMVVHEQAFGAGRGQRSFVVVYMAPGMAGLGSGIAWNGEVVRGCSGGAGEFGHIVVEPAGPRCACGNRGCLQAVIGGENIVRNVNWGDREVAGSLAEAAQLVRVGDKRAIDTFRQAGRSFGQGLANLVNLLNPPLTIISGPAEVVGAGTTPDVGRRGHRARRTGKKVVTSASVFRDGFEDTLAKYSFARLEADCRIEIRRMTMDMTALGAAMLESGVDDVSDAPTQPNVGSKRVRRVRSQLRRRTLPAR